MTDVSLFLLITAISFIVILFYFVGGKKNKRIFEEVAAELEKLFSPIDKEYTNIGGFIGYHFNYDIKDEFIEHVQGTFTLLPRHSILFYPISLVTSKFDKIFITITLKKSFAEEIHIIESRLKSSKLHRVTNSELEEDSSGKFTIYYKSKEGKSFALKCVAIMEHSQIKHLALFPPEKRIYLFVTLKEKAWGSKIGDILLLLKSYLL